jgi:aryl-alcohol dehydrogenase
MAALASGCTTIIGIDRWPSRLELARELGATHVVDATEADAVEAIRGITGLGADFSLETTGSTDVLRQAVDCTAPVGVCGAIGAPPFGAEVSLDVHGLIAPGRTVRGILEGDSIPASSIPRLIALWEQGRFPVERLMTFYDFDQINEAVHDAEAGTTIKPVLRM